MNRKIPDFFEQYIHDDPFQHPESLSYDLQPK